MSHSKYGTCSEGDPEVMFLGVKLFVPTAAYKEAEDLMRVIEGYTGGQGIRKEVDPQEVRELLRGFDTELLFVVAESARWSTISYCFMPVDNKDHFLYLIKIILCILNVRPRGTDKEMYFVRHGHNVDGGNDE